MRGKGGKIPLGSHGIPFSRSLLSPGALFPALGCFRDRDPKNKGGHEKVRSSERAPRAPAGLGKRVWRGGRELGIPSRIPCCSHSRPTRWEFFGIVFPWFLCFFFFPCSSLWGRCPPRAAAGNLSFFFSLKSSRNSQNSRERPRQGRGLAAPPSRTLQGHRSHCLGNLGKIRPPCPGSRGPARSSGIGSSGIRCLVLPEVAGTLIPVPIPSETGFTGIAPFAGISSLWFLGSCEGI